MNEELGEVTLVIIGLEVEALDLATDDRVSAIHDGTPQVNSILRATGADDRR